MLNGSVDTSCERVQCGRELSTALIMIMAMTTWAMLKCYMGCHGHHACSLSLEREEYQAGRNTSSGDSLDFGFGGRGDSRKFCHSRELLCEINFREKIARARKDARGYADRMRIHADTCGHMGKHVDTCGRVRTHCIRRELEGSTNLPVPHR